MSLSRPLCISIFLITFFWYLFHCGKYDTSYFTDTIFLSYLLSCGYLNFAYEVPNSKILLWKILHTKFALSLWGDEQNQSGDLHISLFSATLGHSWMSLETNFADLSEDYINMILSCSIFLLMTCSYLYCLLNVLNSSWFSLVLFFKVFFWYACACHKIERKKRSLIWFLTSVYWELKLLNSSCELIRYIMLLCRWDQLTAMLHTKAEVKLHIVGQMWWRKSQTDLWQ